MGDLKKRMHFINVLLDKWLKSDKLNDQELGGKVRKWYYKNENRVEHWMIDEGNVPWDSDDESSVLSGQELDDLYGDGEDEIY